MESLSGWRERQQPGAQSANHTGLRKLCNHLSLWRNALVWKGAEEGTVTSAEEKQHWNQNLKVPSVSIQQKPAVSASSTFVHGGR